MKISIITAVYNGGDAMAATIDSVAHQDYGNIEHIVVDGGSTDGTLAAVHRNGSRVTRLISEPDNGVYDAFNKGLRAAAGDVVAYLNCGDSYTSPTVISRMADILSSGEVDAVFADVLIVDAQHRDRVLRKYSSKRFSPQNLRYGLMPAHPSLFVRRELYLRVGGYNPSFRVAGDYELCLRLFLKHPAKYHYLNEATVRMPTGGLSNRGWRSKLLITREMREACAMNGVDTNVAKLCLRFPLKFLEMM